MTGPGGGFPHRVCLAVVDVQHDACDAGALGVAGGGAVVRRISAWVAAERQRYAAVVASRDEHEEPGGHVVEPGERPDWQDRWPPHGLRGTPGAQVHPDLRIPLDAEFTRGRFGAADSGVEGTTGEGEVLAGWLARRGIDSVHVAGPAMDLCVAATARDAHEDGLHTTVLADVAAGVAPEAAAAAPVALAEAGVTVTTTDELRRG